MALSPMMQQYLDIKEQYPDAALLFSALGDFYETVLRRRQAGLPGAGADADAARTADWQSARPCAACPTTLWTAYVAKLIEKGYKVAICEQMEDPAPGQGPGRAGR